jgi:CspA family cold shock protein
VVKWYNSIKGFGFIGPDQGGRYLRAHHGVLERSGIIGLAEGRRVVVDVADGQKGRFLLSLWCELGDGSE